MEISEITDLQKKGIELTFKAVKKKFPMVKEMKLKSIGGSLIFFTGYVSLNALVEYTGVDVDPVYRKKIEMGDSFLDNFMFMSTIYAYRENTNDVSLDVIEEAKQKLNDLQNSIAKYASKVYSDLPRNMAIHGETMFGSKYPKAISDSSYYFI